MSNFKAKYIAFRDIVIQKTLRYISAHGSFTMGLLLTLTILIISLFNPCPTTTQFQLFRIILAGGIAGLTASLAGFFKLAYSGLKLGTGIVVFLLVYFTDPATTILHDNCNPQKSLRGRLLMNNTPMPGVQVAAPVLNETDITNQNGDFDIPYRKGNLLETLTLFLSSRNFYKDTLLKADELLKEPLIINISDTISSFDTLKARILIGEYLQRQEQKLKAEHRELMHHHHGQAVSLTDICKLYDHYHAPSAGYRNQLSFTNGFKSLHTQKEIAKAGIDIHPMTPCHAYYLDHYEIYLYEEDLPAPGDPDLYLHYAFFNTEPVATRIRQIREIAPEQYEVIAEHTQNIRQVRNISFHPGKPGEKKRQETHYSGIKPRELYLFRFRNNQWQIIHTKY